MNTACCIAKETRVRNRLPLYEYIHHADVSTGGSS